MKNRYPIYSHMDIVHEYYKEITELFESLGCLAPQPSEFIETTSWRYCKTEDKKSKGKIGYRCCHEWKNEKPVVKIIVHSFRNGGETVVFNSLQYSDRLLDTLKISNPKKRISIASKNKYQVSQEEQEKRKHTLFQNTLNEWQSGSHIIDFHPYVIRKEIQPINNLKIISQNRLIYPLYNVDFDVTGLQIIYPNGDKKIYGKKKGSFGLIGNIESASKLYLCEGLATAHAIFHLVKATQKRASPYAVIIGVDNQNLETVSKVLKKSYPEKTLILCPDNDHKKSAVNLPNAGLLSGYKAAIANYTELKIPPDHFNGSDWCDAWQENPDAASAAFAEKKRIKLIDYTQEILRCFKPLDDSIQLKKCVVRAFKTAAQFYPSRLAEDDFLPKIIAATQHTALSEKAITEWWQKIKRRQFAMALRTKSVHQHQSGHIHLLECVSLEDASKQVQSLKKQYPRAIFITNAPMGIGKTKIFMQPEFHAAEKAGRVPIIITPSRALTQGVCERFHASHYTDDEILSRDKCGETIPASLAITINSIIQPKYQIVFKFAQNVFIDEYTQVLRSITSGTVENHARQKTENRLADLIQNAYYTYIADADFNQIALQHLQELITDDRPIFLFKLKLDKKLPTPNYQVYQDEDPNFSTKLLIQKISESASQNQKLYIATDSKTKIDVITESLKSMPHLAILSITANSIHFPEQQAFLKDPSTYLEKNKPDVVIVSPAIQSGVSIEVPYFDECYGLYTGVVTPVVFQQMLHRVRTATTFKICLPFKSQRKNSHLENSTAILLAAYQHHLQQFGGTTQISFDPKTRCHTLGSLSIKEEGGKITITGDTDYQRYEKLCAELQALDHQQRHHAANFLLLQAMARGIQITAEKVALKKFEKETLNNNLKFIERQSETYKVQAIVQAPTLTEEEYQLQQKKGARDENEGNALQRFEIAKDLHLTTVEETDVCYHQNQGTQHVANYIALLHGEEQAHKNDEKDREQGVAKVNAKWRTAKVQLLKLIFTVLDIDLQDGTGDYDKTKARTLRETINANEMLKRYVLFKLQLKIDSHLHDVAFVNKILKKLLGLSAKRQQIRDEENRYWIYTINSESFNTLRFYYNNFQMKGSNMKKSYLLSPQKVIGL